MNIPIKDVLSRDETVPHNHMQALFIYNLEPSYMGGSHWVATYVKNGDREANGKPIINYFDSFGMCRKLIVEHFRFKEMISFLVFWSLVFTNIPV